jgi:hypothetical protein
MTDKWHVLKFHLVCRFPAKIALADQFHALRDICGSISHAKMEKRVFLGLFSERVEVIGGS